MANGSTFRQESCLDAKRQGFDTSHTVGGVAPTLADGAVGLLSRTVIPSTTIQWILPARIRHRDHNDVVFVSESFIQLSELLPTRLLANVPARLDFGCRILAAKVLSQHALSSFADLVVKQEQHEDYDSDQATPPQILVLALDSCEIAFVYAEGTAPKQIKFRSARKKLPVSYSALGQYGRHMAVDSRSCTVAISPASGQFALLRLKPLPELCKEIAALDPKRPHTSRPLTEERFIPVNGLILKLEFLLSPSQGQAKTVLALLIAKNAATWLCLYSWEENQPLKFAMLNEFSPHRLSDIDRLPLMMIPSSQDDSFTLVTESGLAVYNDVLSTNVGCTHIEIPQVFPEKFVGSSRSPLWVQWAKPPRHSGYRMTNDDFVLVREDGHLEYFEIKHDFSYKIDTRYEIGSLNINVDSAFAILDAPPGYGGDIYVVGGDMNNGAVYHTRARNQAESFQTITNLAPIRDMLILDSTGQDAEEKRVFVCTGKGEGHAAVAEIRRGLEARIGFEAEQVYAASARRIWILSHAEGDKCTILFSLPFRTEALRIDFEHSDMETVDDELANQGLILGEQTLAFSAAREAPLLQITPAAVAILSPHLGKSPFMRLHAKAPVLLASVHSNGMLFATISVANEGFEVLVSSISTYDGSLDILDYPGIYSTEAEPSSLALLDLDGKHLLVVGTIVGTIHILEVELGRGPRLISSHSITTLFPEAAASAVCSLACLEDSALGSLALACGTRNGWVLGLTVTPGVPSHSVEECSAQDVTEETSDGPNTLLLCPKSCRRIGPTDVELIMDSANRSSALLLCNSEVYQLAFTPSEWAVNFPVRRVWWTNVAVPELDQPKVSAVASLATQTSSKIHDLESRLFCLTQNDVLVASLALESRIVPRRIMVSGDPCKLIYCKLLRKLVVSVDQVQLVPDCDPRRPLRRAIRPGIQLLDPDTGTSDPANKHVLRLGQCGSRIISMLSWTPTNGMTTLDIIVVSLYIDRPNRAHCDGRLICLTVGKDGRADGSLDKDTGRAIRFGGCPVYSLAPFGDSSLIVCAGADIFLQTLDVSTLKWTRTGAHRLPSPALSIHISGRSVYTATARHSLKVFEVSAHGYLTLPVADIKTKDVVLNTTHFVGSDEGGLLAVSSNKGSRLLGLFKHESSQTVLGRVFDVSLPLMITCLREISDEEAFTKAGKRYYGSTHDGSMYEFTILSKREWQCLDFIARLAWKRPVARTHNYHRHILRHAGKRKRFLDSPHRQEEGGLTMRPSDMHISGDKIAELVQSGPEEFRRLLDEGRFRKDLLGHESLAPPDQKSLLSQLAELGGAVFKGGMTDNDNHHDSDIVLLAFRWMQRLVGGDVFT